MALSGLLVMIVAGTIASASWFLVERPTLALKDRHLPFEARSHDHLRSRSDC